MKKSLWESLYLSFAITRLKIGLTEKMRKIDKKISQNGLPNPREPPWAYLMSPNQCATRTYQTPLTEFKLERGIFFVFSDSRCQKT